MQESQHTQTAERQRVVSAELEEARVAAAEAERGWVERHEAAVRAVREEAEASASEAMREMESKHASERQLKDKLASQVQLMHQALLRVKQERGARKVVAAASAAVVGSDASRSSGLEVASALGQPGGGAAVAAAANPGATHGLAASTGRAAETEPERRTAAVALGRGRRKKPRRNSLVSMADRAMLEEMYRLRDISMAIGTLD
jgi:hypothetical protein